MQKKGRARRIKKEKACNKDLKIYDLSGKLIYIAREGFNFSYQELLRRKSKYSHSKRA